jgi:hypothetical protein
MGKKVSLIFFVCIIMILLSCNFSRKNHTSNANISVDTDTCFICQNNENVFKDTIWFLPYLNIFARNATRQIFEKWVYKISDNCLTFITLYADSTYLENSCEVDGWLSGGFYHYCNDTLYCVEITPENEYDAEHNQPSIKGIEKYVREKDRLQFFWRKEQIVGNKMNMVYTEGELIFIKQ